MDDNNTEPKLLQKILPPACCLEFMQCNATVRPRYAILENVLPKTSLTIPLPSTKVWPVLLRLTLAILALLMIRLHWKWSMLLLER